MIQALPPPEPQAIIVTGSALPSPGSDRIIQVESLSSRDLKSSAPVPIERLLERLAGLQQFRRSDSRSAHPTSQGPTLRALGGNAAGRALVLLDGIPQADPFGGWIAWPAFSSLGLGGVRLVRGGGSVAAGPGALAGTLELSSRNDMAAMVVAEMGARNSAAGEALLTQDLGSGLLSLSLRGSRSDGFAPVTATTRGPADRRAPHRTGSARLRWVAPVGADAELQGTLAVFSDRRDRGLAFTGNRTRGTDVSVRAVSRGALPWTALVYAQSRDFRSSFAATDAGRESARRVSLQYDVPGSALGWSAEVRPRASRDLDLRFGFDGRHMSGSSREFANYVAGDPTRQREAGGQASHMGLFAEVTVRLGTLRLSGAGRLDRWRIFDGELVERRLADNALLIDEAYSARAGVQPTGRIGAAFQANDEFSFRGAAYLGWRLPTLNELFRPFRAGSDATAANPALRPERLQGIEAGGDWAKGPWEASATLFVNRLHRPIANVTIAAGPGLFPGVGFVAANGAYRRRQNLDAIGARGLEISGGWESGPWSSRLSASFADAKVRASGVAEAIEGRRPAQTPRVAASIAAVWDSSGDFGGVALRYEGSRFEDDLNQQRLPAALIADINAGLRLQKRLTLTARAENLFNAKAIATRSADGTEERSLPRTLWIGLRLGSSR